MQSVANSIKHSLTLKATFLLSYGFASMPIALAMYLVYRGMYVHMTLYRVAKKICIHCLNYAMYTEECMCIWLFTGWPKRFASIALAMYLVYRGMNVHITLYRVAKLHLRLRFGLIDLINTLKGLKRYFWMGEMFSLKLVLSEFTIQRLISIYISEILIKVMLSVNVFYKAYN